MKELIRFLKTTPSFSHWKRIGIKHHHGMCVPLFSLHSDNSCGIGEFLDLIPMIEFCKQVNFNVLQLLPLNDSGLDSSPYNCISAFALNPIYLSILAIPEIKNNDKYSKQIKILKSSNMKKSYIFIYKLKHAILYDYYLSQISNKCDNDILFEKFKKNSSFWLFPYSLFKTLKIQYNWHSWNFWDKDIRNINNIYTLFKKYYKKVNFHCYIQYLCYKQLKKVKDYAEQHNLLIKGDLPILVSKESCDVWFYKKFFSLSNTAGAPPDIYNKKGQNWMFPLYNWKNLEKEDYIWWKERLKQHVQFYDIYRLDHIVGFFRIWAIKLTSNGHQGKFIPKTKEDCLNQGKAILNMMLQSSKMLPIGEDLGIVPDYVKEEMFRLGICGTKIIRWERNWDGDNSFLPYYKYSKLSLTSVSSHDSDTLYQWWKNSPKEAQLFSIFKQWKYKKILSREKHREILKDSHHTPSLFHINLIQEYLALIPNLISPHSLKERINTPGTISKANWSYRCIPSIEELLKHNKLKSIISSLTEK